MGKTVSLTTAYHEAGHALADFRLGFRIRSISIIPNDESFGLLRRFPKPTFFDKFDQAELDRKDIAEAHDWIISLFAGQEAQRRFRPNSLRPHHGEHDVECIDTILERLFHPDEHATLMKYLRVRTRLLIERPMNWRMISDLAEALVQQPSMKGRDVVAVFRQSLKNQLSERRSRRGNGSN